MRCFQEMPPGCRRILVFEVTKCPPKSGTQSEGRGVFRGQNRKLLWTFLGPRIVILQGVQFHSILGGCCPRHFGRGGANSKKMKGPSYMIWAVLSGPPQARELLADWQIIHALHKLVEFHKTVSVLVVPLELADHWRHFNVDLGLANGTTTVLHTGGGVAWCRTRVGRLARNSLATLNKPWLRLRVVSSSMEAVVNGVGNVPWNTILLAHGAKVVPQPCGSVPPLLLGAKHWKHLIAEIEQLPPCSNVFCRNSPVRCHHGGGASVG